MNFARLFQTVVGDDGSNMERWRSFRFCVLSSPGSLSGRSAHIALSQFMRGLEHQAPHLESLSVHVNVIDDYFSPYEGLLQDLRCLKSLTINASGPLGDFGCIPEDIKTLCFRLWGSTEVMSPFSNVRYLSLACVHDDAMSYEDDPEIVFPSLESLTLEVWLEWEAAKEAVQKYKRHS